MTLSRLGPSTRIAGGTDKLVTPLLAEDETLLWATPVNLAAYARAGAGALALAMSVFVFSFIVLTACVAAIVGVGLTLSAANPPQIPAIMQDMAKNPATLTLPLALSILALAGMLHALGRCSIIIRGAFSIYAMTDRRCMVIAPGKPSLRAWVPVARILGAHTRINGKTGSIILSIAPQTAPLVLSTLALTGIKKADAVEALIMDLIAPANEQ